jgi:hypothetical protein
VPRPTTFVHTGRFQGTGVPILNRAHPLAQNLVGCYAPGAFPNVPVTNLASPGSGDLTMPGGGAFLSPTPEGPGVALTGTTTNLYLAGIAPRSMQIAGRVSLFVRGQWTDGPGVINTPGSIFGLTYNTTGASSPYYSYALSPTTGNEDHCIGLCYAENSSTFTNPDFTNGPSVLVANTMVSGGAVFPGTPGGTAFSVLYQNGVQYLQAIPIAQTFGVYGATPWVTIGDPGGRGRNMGMTVTVAYLWNRVLTAQEQQYLDANPYALLLFQSDNVSLALARPSAGTAITADAILSAEFLENLRNNAGIPVESLGTGSTAVTRDVALSLEFLATVLHDWGASKARSIIRRFSRPALVGRVRRLFFPGRGGTLAIESEGRQQADPGAPIESLGSAGSSVAGDAMSPIETLSSKRSELGAAIENSASLRVDRGVPAEALAASLLARIIHEALEATVLQRDRRAVFRGVGDAVVGV